MGKHSKHTWIVDVIEEGSASIEVDGRSVTTVDGLDASVRDGLLACFVATGGSQCGFCTPGIIVRMAAAEARGKTRRVDPELYAIAEIFF